MKARALLLAAFASLAAPLASATPSVVSGNELWVAPSELGWGANIFHQGDTLFVSLFVYGPDGKPRWYTGSNLKPVNGNQTYYSGQLYDSRGPAFGTAFDPAAVARRPVGDIFVSLTQESAGLDYTIDGVAVHKLVFPFTFELNDSSGTYMGFETSITPRVADEVAVTIDQRGTSFTMLTMGNALGACTHSGTYSQVGQMGKVSGVYTCAGGTGGQFTFRELDPTPFGFTARFTSTHLPETVQVHIGGVRTQGAGPHGVGSLTDLWWVPSESGWGLNIVEQGDTLFGTLFVYGADNFPKWYSASSMRFNGSRWVGTLSESTGPYFGTSFNPSAVTRRDVGVISFDSIGRDAARVDISIDGVVVSKVMNRAAFRFNDLAGTYAGNVAVVPPNSSMGGIPTGTTTFDVVDTSSGTTLRTHAAGGDCTWTGQDSLSQQYGQQRMVGGTYTCTNGGSGRFFLSDIEVTFSGFTGMLTADGFGVANVGGTRTNAF